MNDFDALIKDDLEEMTELFDTGLSSERPDMHTVSTEERFIQLSKRVWEMAMARPDTKAVNRPGFRNKISRHDMVLRQVAAEVAREKERKSAAPSRN